ncbi:MAG: CD225/dispanin family protein [Corynebacterium sp.]|nr:CD225/dispanin family protein [Corynebacterium sp.]
MTEPFNPYDPNGQQPHFNQGYGAGMPYGAMPNGMMKPDNQLVWTILSTIICCVPLGAIGIYYSMQVDKYWEAGMYAEAEGASRKAKNFAIAGAVSIVILLVLYIIFIVMLAMFGQASESTSSY